METLTKPKVTRSHESGRRQNGTSEHAKEPAHAVVADGLTKRYGDRAAIDNLSFTVPAGSVAGLIGPNGAGKTTLMAMLLGLVRPTEGSGNVLGHSLDRPAEYLGRVGASIESPAFHAAVSGIDNLRALALLGGRGQDEIPALIERVGLEGRGSDRYGSYSLGMKQRLAVAASLLGDPEVVVLDEPTNGLDPLGMQEIRRLIGSIAREGRTVIVSSHLLSELEQVCDWLIVIDHGGLVYLGGPEDLVGGESIVVGTADPADLEIVQTLVESTGLPFAKAANEIVVTLDGTVDASLLAAEINRRAHIAGVSLSQLHCERADLEARYLKLVSNQTDTTSKGLSS